MHLIPPDNLPHRCAVIPGRTTDPDGFVATGVVLTGWDPEIEVSVAGAKELGRMVGMVPKEHVETLADQAREMAAELVEVKQRLADFEAHRELEVKIAEPLGMPA